MWPFGKKSKVHNLGDKVWIKKEKKYSSLATDAKQYVNDGKLVLLAYHFKDTEVYLSKKLEENNIAAAKMHEQGSVFQSKINIVQANNFLSQSFIDKLSYETHEIIILFAEHYPLFSTEKNIIKSLGSSDKTISYCFYVSLDEPIMRIFGAERIMKLMSAMGIGEEEMISHPMISKAIESAQQKIETKVTSEMKTNSMEEWFEKNFHAASK